MTDATAVRTERRAISAFSFGARRGSFFRGGEGAAEIVFAKRKGLPLLRGGTQGENRLGAPDKLPYARVCDKVYQSKAESLLNLPEGFGIMNLPKFGGSI